jgi:3-oxoacyl-[acyl-carrier protein] reductase
MKTILITGGSRGIGLAIAEKYLETEEYNVVVTGRKEETLKDLSNEVNNKNFHTIAAKADDEEAADKTCKDLNEKFGSLDILVNNAGTNPAGGALMDVDIGAVQKTWDVNLLGPLLWSRAAYKNELSTAIMNICSVGGIAPSQLMGAYNVSKAALIYLTKQLAYELAPDIRVNGVAPAIVKTKLSQLLWENEEFAKNLHLLKKLGEPEDIANAVYYMCSDDAGWVTGEVLTIDGGFLLSGNSMI